MKGSGFRVQGFWFLVSGSWVWLWFLVSRLCFVALISSNDERQCGKPETRNHKPETTNQKPQTRNP